MNGKFFKCVALALLPLCFGVLFFGCGTTHPEETDVSADSLTEKVNVVQNAVRLEELSEYNGKILCCTEQLSDNILVLAYREEIPNRDRTYLENLKSQILTYDLNKKRIVGVSEEFLSTMPSLCGLKLLKNNFYIFIDEDAIVFDADCRVSKKFKLPIENYMANNVDYILTDDLEKCIYSKAGELVISDSDGNNPTAVYKEGPGKPSFSKIFLTSSPDIIAFFGSILAESEGESEKCYGTLNIKTGKIDYSVANHCYATASGDNVIIQSTSLDVGMVRNGYATIFNAVTKEEKRIESKYSDNEEYFNIAKDPSYIIGTHYDESKPNDLTFNIYHNLALEKTVSYTFENENDAASASKVAPIFMNAPEGELIVPYYDNENKCYMVLSITAD